MSISDITEGGENAQQATDPELVRQWDRDHVLHPWQRDGAAAPVVTDSRGSRFRDSDGREYLDFTSQLFFTNLGHSEPRLASAAHRQMSEMAAVASSFATEPMARLAQLLAEITPGDLSKSLFTTTGAEANEAAIGMVRAASGRQTIVSRYRSYHGSTAAAAGVGRDPRNWPAAVGAPGSVAALDPYCYRCPFGLRYPSCELRCAEHVREVIRWNGGAEYLAGLVIEPVTGANGVIVPPDGYLQRIREICDQEGLRLVADEVMVGFGRTGEWFACDHWGVTPDVMTVSKGLTNGAIPLAATVIRPDLARVFEERPLLQGHTASGNATACAVAVRAIEIYRDEQLIPRARTMGAYLKERALELAERHRCIGDVRGLGLFLGLELVTDRTTREPFAQWPQRFPPQPSPVSAMLRDCRERGLFLASPHPSVLHLAPPLTVERAEIDEAIEILDTALTDLDALCDERG